MGKTSEWIFGLEQELRCQHMLIISFKQPVYFMVEINNWNSKHFKVYTENSQLLIIFGNIL